MMDFEVLHGAAALATPIVPTQYLQAKRLVLIAIQPQR
jgi:hypothetical protein